MKFKVGDSVVWCAAKGRVVKIWKFKSEFAASIQVEFWASEIKFLYRPDVGDLSARQPYS